MTDATPPTTPCMPIIHTQPGSSSPCLCHRSGSGGSGLHWEGVQCPLSLLTLSPVGSGEGLCISKRLCGFHLWIRMWITLDGERLCKCARIKKSKRISVSLDGKQGSPKNWHAYYVRGQEEFRYFYFFLMPGGVYATPSFGSYYVSLDRCHFVFLSPRAPFLLQLFKLPPSPLLKALWDWCTETSV